jgi:hypothetical protein
VDAERTVVERVAAPEAPARGAGDEHMQMRMPEARTLAALDLDGGDRPEDLVPQLATAQLAKVLPAPVDASLQLRAVAVGER